MAHKKAGGSTRNNRDSNPKYLGIKVSDGSKISVGSILVRQRGSLIMPGKNVKIGRDHTLYSMKEGLVKITNKRKVHFDGSTVVKKVASVV